jgi:hypothetical protein
LNEPTGVRAAAAMTISVIGVPPRPAWDITAGETARRSL